MMSPTSVHRGNRTGGGIQHLWLCDFTDCGRPDSMLWKHSMRVFRHFCLASAAFFLHTNDKAHAEDHSKLIAAVFDDCHIFDASLQIHTKAQRLPPDERFVFLHHWVLPQDGVRPVRINLGFSPTYPGLNAQSRDTEGQRIATGGDVVCPAVDLVELAKQLGRLNSIRSIAARIDARSRSQKKNLLAFRCLIEVADGNFAEATRLAEEALERIDSDDPYDEVHRSAELLLLLQADSASSLREILADQFGPLFGSSRWPSIGNVWSRHFARLLFPIIPVLPEDDSFTLSVPTGAPSHWNPVTFPSALRRGLGMPPAKWRFTNSQAINASSHGDDILYFDTPMLGDVEIEDDMTVSNWREAEMIVGARWVAPSFPLNFYDVGTPRRMLAHRELTKPTTRTAHWYRHRTQLRGATATFSLDGRVVHEETMPEVRDPWIGVRSRHLNEGGARNVHISGDANIPEYIDMLGSGLDSWIDYFGEDAPWDQLPWTFRNNEISGRRQRQRTATPTFW
ncbi:MAG TPA: DUF1581 domain-containing protein [Planctomycetes bacterium]|nr:DUF1581 domain-containing protein [Fuerstiella sp.]HIK93086.1 DUF1581 domain-containing protein [Planctomycetota bacterium]